MSNSSSNTHTEARSRYVMGKIKDDFYNAAYRGFTTISTTTLLNSWKDIEFVMNENTLFKCQMKFTWDEKAAAVNYEVVSDGSIQIDSESAMVNLHQIPAHANIYFVIRRDHTNAAVSDYLEKKGWVSNASFLEGTSKNVGGYSNSGFGIDLSTIGI